MKSFYIYEKGRCSYEERIQNSRNHCSGFHYRVLVWCLVPTRFCNIDAQQVEKIEVFDGSRGVELEISDSEEIAYLVDNWNQASASKRIIPLPAGGFKFHVTVYLESGKTGRIHELIQEDDAKREIIYYKRAKGNLCYEYLDDWQRKLDNIRQK